MKTILIPTDTKSFNCALRTAASFLRGNAGKIILMHNVETLLTNWTRLSEKEKLNYPDVTRYTAKVHYKLLEITSAEFLNGLPIETLITYGVTSDEILDAAAEVHADLIIMPSHRSKGSNGEFIGSTLQKVVRQSPCPVLSVKEDIDTTNLKRMVVPVSLNYDISEPFDEVIKISKALGSVIQLLFVNSPQHFRNTGEIQKLISEFKAKYPNVAIETAVYDHVQIEKGILEFVETSRADCIAMITFEHKRAPSYQLSTTDYILHHATVPVLTVYDGVKNLRRKRSVALA